MKNTDVQLNPNVKSWIERNGYPWKAFGKPPFKTYFIGEAHGEKRQAAAQTELVSSLRPEYILLENVYSLFRPDGSVTPIADMPDDNLYSHHAEWVRKYGATIVGWEPSPEHIDGLPVSKRGVISRNRRQAEFARTYANRSENPVLAVTGLKHLHPDYRLKAFLTERDVSFVFVSQDPKREILF